MKTQYETAGADHSAADGFGGADAAQPADVTQADQASTLAASNPYRIYQWYLDGAANGASNGANVDAISTEYSGQGAVIGIIDEGFDTTNPDLAGRFDLSLSHDPRDHGATNIMPDSSAAVHGTWVAGVLGASADNDYGIVGVAPDATLAGFYARFGAGGSSRAELADLLARQVNVDVSNNSWGYTTEFGDNFQNSAWSAVSSALQTDATQGRDGLGTVLVFAAGNGRQYIAGSSTYDDDNTNDHNLTNSRFVITAAASTEDGHIAPYSTPGASILVTAPGDSILTTTDNNNDGNPNNDFAYVSGTSFAAPIVSGVVAMMLEANPDLGYRDVQEILALSSEKIDHASSSWSTNGATNWNGGANLVSNDFGFGLIDAHAAVRLAETWTNTHTAANEQEISLAGNVGGNGALVDFHPSDYTATVPTSDQNFSIDWVTVDVALQHSHIGDLKIDLISPTGTDSVLMDMPADGTDAQSNLSFTFSTDHDWGESPVGTWTLVVEDEGTGGTGSLLSYAIHIYGDQQGADTTYYYTDDFATLAGDRGTINDPSGMNTIDAAAVTSDLALDLHPGAVSTIAGRAVTISPTTTVVTAYGGDGNDTIIGNDAGDHLYGGHGTDTIVGGHGDDTIDGGAGADTMAGGAGNDTYFVDNAGDQVIEHANEGIDTVISSISHTLSANVENLELTGSGNINGTGNELDNVIVSNTGVDTLIGGDGHDTYFVHNTLDHVVETPTGGSDTVYADVNYTLPANVETLVLVGSGDTHAATDALDTTHALDIDTTGGLDNIDGVGNDLDNTLIGTAGDNVLDGGHGADTMIGGAGNDTYMVDSPGDTIVEYANEGTDTVITHVDYTLPANVENLTLSGPDSLSGTGNDLGNVIIGNDAGDTIDGGGGDDGLAGGAGNDHISGGDGADWIYGLGGDDVLQGGAGNDVLFGGDGNDTLIGGDGDNFLSGDAGNDTIDGGNGDNFMFGGDGDDHIIGGDGNDAIAAGAGNDMVDGGAGINWIDGGDGNDVLSGGNGSNALFGGAGDDQLQGGDGVDGLDGGAGNDVLIGGGGDDWLYGEEGNDTLIGGAGNDVMVGGEGDDRVVGGEGDDRVVGGEGTDFLAGGAGADTFVFNAPADGGDVVCDFTSGVDVIEINAAGFGLSASGALPDAMFAHGDVLPADFDTHGPVFYADQTYGGLWFDPTGGSSSDAVLVAGFVGALPTASDFHLV